MGKVDFIPKIWSARFQKELNDKNVYGNLTNSNYEGEISSAGDSVRIPTLVLDVNVRDYVENTAMTDPLDLPDATSVDLTITQKKAFRIFVDSILKAQSKPELMSESMRKAGVKVADTLDDYLKGIFKGTFSTDGDDRIVNVETALNDANFFQKVLDGVIELKQKMSEALIPC